MSFQKRIKFFIILCVFSSYTLGDSHEPDKECYRSADTNTPNQRFKDKAYGTIFDTKTGLTWSRCPLGMKWDKGHCLDVPDRMNWNEADFTIMQLNDQGGYAGFRDWRLPTLEELSSLVESKCYEPAINSAIFPNTPNIGFWSITPDKGSRNGAWLVYFLNGSRYLGNQDYEWAVRAVRN